MHLKNFLKVLLILVSIALASFFIFRNSILHWAFDKVKEKCRTKYHITLQAGTIKFTGLQEISITGITAVPDSSDTLAIINNAKINLSLINYIRGSVGIDAIVLDTFYVRAYNERDRNNISFLKGNSAPADSNNAIPKSTVSYREMLERVTDKTFKILYTKLSVKEFMLSYKDSLREERLKIPDFNYDKKTFSGEIVSLNDRNNDTLLFSGEVLSQNKIYNFFIHDKTADNNYLPFLNADRQLRCRFNSVAGTVELDKTNSDYTVKTDLSINNIHINHWRLADEDVVFPLIEFTGKIKIEDDAVTLDSVSELKLNHATFNVYLHHEKKPSRLFSLKIKMPEVAADSFFQALPGGMFRTLKGIKTSGTLAYRLDFSIDKDHPDDLVFDSQLKKKNFRIIQYGAENYSRINNTFLFDAMDGDRLVRKIIVGPENPSFTPLDQISTNLIYAVLTSEDGSFLYHKGFNEDAFRESIITNYKAGRFVRGGSTISMQLVKNCFLSRDKTISRKAEEALIVWLIENNGLVSKQRMLEVYLNVIEWGPDVYGIGEASAFYFEKPPKNLSLAESIFLTSIIPHPKYFKYSFDSTGTLKPFLAPYFNLISSKMLGRNWITPADTTGLQPTVKLTGSAKQFVLPADTFTIPPDSILREDIEELQH